VGLSESVSTEAVHGSVHRGETRLGSHFFFAVWALTLPFCNFFCRFGYFVAGFLAVRLPFLDMTTLFAGDSLPLYLNHILGAAGRKPLGRTVLHASRVVEALARQGEKSGRTHQNPQVLTGQGLADMGPQCPV
jgi:hypothetical protein